MWCISLIPALLMPIFLAETAAVAGTDPARVCAQIRAESAWRPNASSGVAHGLGQFTPPTWGDEAPKTRPSCAGVPSTDPTCSIRANINYMRQLDRRYRMSATADDQRRFAEAAYNMGMGWLDREKAKCRVRARCNPLRWYTHVEESCSRNPSSCEETRGYVRRIDSFLERG